MAEMSWEEILTESTIVAGNFIKNRFDAVYNGPFAEERGPIAYPQFEVLLKNKSGFVFVYPTAETVNECSEFEDVERINRDIKWSHENECDFYAVFVCMESPWADGQMDESGQYKFTPTVDMIPFIG